MKIEKNSIVISSFYRRDKEKTTQKFLNSSENRQIEEQVRTGRNLW
jgi:hypothetical protein